MPQFFSVPAAAIATFALIGLAQQVGPYKVLKTVRVGGEGGWDYIYADTEGRRLYIPRGATREVAATETTPAVPAVQARLTMFNLDTLEPAGEIAGVGGNGTAVDPKSGHGFTSDHPKVSMFDTKTMKLIKSIDVGAARPDGIYFDAFNQRVYVFSHPTKDATVIDSKDGTVLGTIDLGGVPEQGVGDRKGMLYVVMQDAVGSVTAVDVKTMKAIEHYSFVDKGGCNGLALDVKNEVLFAACGRSGNPPAQPAKPMMVILNAKDGKILTSLPLAGGSDGAVFNPATMEAFSTHGRRFPMAPTTIRWMR
jgi:DNA-binding beta-propeller fold protein YncE